MLDLQTVLPEVIDEHFKIDEFLVVFCHLSLIMLRVGVRIIYHDLRKYCSDAVGLCQLQLLFKFEELPVQSGDRLLMLGWGQLWFFDCWELGDVDALVPVSVSRERLLCLLKLLQKFYVLLLDGHERVRQRVVLKYVGSLCLRLGELQLQSSDHINLLEQFVLVVVDLSLR